MKKILILCLASVAVFAAQAQSKTTSSKMHKPVKQSAAVSKYNKQESAKKMSRQARLDSMMAADSMRFMSDNLSDVAKDSARAAYRAAGLRAIDSMDRASYTAAMKQRNMADQRDRAAADLSKEADLSTYQTSRVNYINQQYNDKAKAIMQQGDAAAQQSALVSLNEERRAKIRAVVGKGTEKRLDRDRKSYAMKNGMAADSQWIDMAEQAASTKK